MTKTRVVQRTPNLGLKIRMVKDVAPVVQADCCEPEIGLARWYNRTTDAYDLETVVVVGDTTMDYLAESNGERRTVVTAQVTGDLCDCTITWDVAVVFADGGE